MAPSAVALTAAAEASVAGLLGALGLVVGGGQRPHRAGEVVDGVAQLHRAPRRPGSRAENGAPARGCCARRGRSARGCGRSGRSARGRRSGSARCGRSRGWWPARRRTRAAVLDPARLLERLLGAARRRRSSSALAVRSSARPSRPNTAWAARLTGSIGSGEKSSAIASATAPPITASRIRFGENAPPPDGPVITSSIAETAASEITSSEPLSSTATDIASMTMMASCGAPVPMKWMITSATARPTTTPATSCSRALAVRAVRGADRDHGRDAGEDRLRVGQQRGRTGTRRPARRSAVCRIANARALQAAPGGGDVRQQRSYV